jgi:hypothetical protein
MIRRNVSSNLGASPLRYFRSPALINVLIDGCATRLLRHFKKNGHDVLIQANRNPRLALLDQVRAEAPGPACPSWKRGEMRDGLTRVAIFVGAISEM